MSQLDFYKQKLSYEIDSWDLNEAIKSGISLVVLDVRQKSSYEKKHIVGAISYPHQNMLAENTQDFDRNTLYVTYCDGLGCNAATTGAMKMTELGFNVRELVGGLAWWSEHGYPIVESSVLKNTEQNTTGNVAVAVT